MNSYDIIIIGSGLGSLVCANILSREGYHVCVMEKHTQPGGCLQNFTRHGHAFDTGVHYIGGLLPGQTLHRYWNYLGILPDIKLHRLNINRFDVIGFDEAEFPLAQGFDNFADQLLPYFPDGRDNLATYIRQIQSISKSFPLYNLELPFSGSNENQFRNRSGWKFINELTTGIRHPGSGIPLGAVLAGNNFLYAGDHDTTPLHQLALINHSFISSAWQLQGGSRQLANALVKNLEKHGGSLLLRHDVKMISKKKNQFAVQTCSGEIFHSSMLISGIHPSETYKLLEPSLVKPMTRNRILNLPNTTGAFSLFLCLKKNTTPFQNHNFHYFNSHDVWSASHTHEANWPSNYMLYTPCPVDGDSFAETMIIMSYMDFTGFKKWEDSQVARRGNDYLDKKHELESKLLDLVEHRFPDLRKNISFMESATPLTWRDYTGTPEGSVYGIRKDYNNSIKTTILPRTKIHHLYLTGQNINLHGLLGVTIGAVMTCGEIIGLDQLLNKIRNAS